MFIMTALDLAQWCSIEQRAGWGEFPAAADARAEQEVGGGGAKMEKTPVRNVQRGVL